MSIDGEFAKGSASVLEEVEAELERLLNKKQEDLERALAERLKQDQTTPLIGAEESGGDRPSLEDRRLRPRAPDADFRTLLEEIRERFKQVLRYQTEIDKLTRLTTEEVTRVFVLLGKASELRDRLLEESQAAKPAAPEILRPAPEGKGPDADILPPDLGQALDRVRKIKELLGDELANKTESVGDVSAPPVAADSAEGQDFEPLLPGIQDLVATPAASVVPETRDAPRDIDRPPPPSPSEFDAFRRSEPASSRSEVHFFRQGRKIILDTARILEAAEKSREEAKRLILKFSQTASSPDQFTVRQGIVSWQEGLRRIVLQVVKMSEKDRLEFPEPTADVLNIGVFKDLLERLSLSDWSRPEDFAVFEKWLQELRERIEIRTPSTSSYQSSVFFQPDED